MFRLRVLGGFALEGPPGSPAPSLPHRRAMAVLAVLAVCGDRGCTRERLLALLWPESDEAHARHGLRTALHAIRHSLAPASIPSTASLLRVDHEVVESDVVTFTRALAAGRRADAARAYGGPLLDGFHLDGAPEFEHWLDGERARLARECAEGLEELARSAEESGAWGEAVSWWGRAVEHDPVNSHFVLHQMRAMSAIGDRANGVQAGAQHVRRLREEFGLEPDPAVLTLIERIRSGELPVPPDGAARVLRPTVAAPPETADVRTDLEVMAAPDGSRKPAVSSRALARVPRWLVWTAGLAAVVVVVAAIQATLRPRTGEVNAGPARTSIAVLPFKNLTTDTSRAWFAAGLHDELLSQLARVASLKVIGAASVASYQGSSKPLVEIGSELGVGSIVHGSIQVLGSRLRVIVQLTDSHGGSELWAATYDRPLDDAFAVQSDIAQQIVAAVGVRLSRTEAGGIAAPPTSDADAYLLYLQGLEYAGRAGDRREDLTIAQRLFEQALQRDSAFALAHAALSNVHGRTYSRRLDVSPARAELQLREARAALRFAPDLPEAHVAMALTFCCGRYGDRQELDALMVALRFAPNDASLWGAVSVVQARLGNWDSMHLAFERARGLDPRNVDLWQAQGNRLHCLRRYQEAIEAYRRALLLAPDYIQPRIALGWSYILWKGVTDTLRSVLEGLPDVEPGGGAPRVGLGQADLLIWDRRPDSLLALVHRLPGDSWISGESFTSRLVLTGAAYAMKGDTGAAWAAYDSAASLLDAALRGRPDDPSLHMTRGGLMATLGRRAEAIREVRWLEQSDGYRNNHSCPSEPEARAVILARIGETDSALAAVERLLAGTSRVTVHTLRLDPLWDALRAEPRFHALLAKYANPGR